MIFFLFFQTFSLEFILNDANLIWFQYKAGVLMKKLNEIQDQIEKATVELSTFKYLQKQEEFAIPRRIQVTHVPCRFLSKMEDDELCTYFVLQSLEDDVSRQMEREVELQKKYAQLQQQLHELL